VSLSLILLIPFGIVLNSHFYSWGNKFSFHYKKDISNIISLVSDNRNVAKQVIDSLDNEYNHVTAECKEFRYSSSDLFNKNEYNIVLLKTNNCDVYYYTKINKKWTDSYVGYIKSIFTFKIYKEGKYLDFLLCHLISLLFIISLFYLIRSQIRIRIINSIIEELEYGNEK
jgi:hypothetical protein